MSSNASIASLRVSSRSRSRSNTAAASGESSTASARRDRLVACAAHDLEAHRAHGVRVVAVALRVRARRAVPATPVPSCAIVCSTGMSRSPSRTMCLQVDRGGVRAGPVGHVDDEDVGDLGQPGFDRLHAVAERRDGDDDDHVGDRDDSPARSDRRRPSRRSRRRSRPRRRAAPRRASPEPARRRPRATPCCG